MTPFPTLAFYVSFALLLITTSLLARARFGRPGGQHLMTLAFLLALLGVAELGSLAALRLTQGAWLYQMFNPNVRLFRRHPYLVSIGRPNVSLRLFGTTINHNSDGFRGPPIDHPKTRERIVAIGGSTTYGVAVDDGDTWPAHLQKLSGKSVEVLNFGLPAHSTVEHIHLASFILPEFAPDIVLINAGLNDLHIANTPSLAPDYANIHAPMMIGNLGLCPTNLLPPIGLLRATWLGLERAGLYPRCEYEERPPPRIPSAEVDTRALALYHRNLSTLVALCQRIGARVILLPQVLVEERLANGLYQWWTPNIDQRVLPTLMARYNSEMSAVAKESGAEYVDTIPAERWSGADFADPSHLNAPGNAKFAGHVRSYLLRPSSIGKTPVAPTPAAEVSAR